MKRHAWLLFLALAVSSAAAVDSSPGRVVEITAGSDNMFRIGNQKASVLHAKPAEALILRITAQPGSETARDGAVHSLVIRSLRDQGWDIRLYPGTHDYPVKAPASGEYLVECTVKCGRGHDDMRLKFIVDK